MPGSRIVIIEDESISALDLRLMLEKSGYVVPAICESGEDALVEIDKNPPDLILMDIRLKGKLDGLDTARIIKTRFNIPVILTTAHSDESLIERAKQIQPFGYILKPVGEKELGTAIELALYRHQLERRLLEREELFFTTLNSIGEAVIVTNTGNRIEYLNPIAENLSGCTNDEAIGADFSKVFIFLEDGKAGIRRLMLPSGKILPVEVRPSPLRKHHQEEAGTVWIIHDISDRMTALDALRKSEERYRRFLRTILQATLSRPRTAASSTATNRS